MALEIKITSQLDKVQGMLEKAVETALEDCGMDAQRFAVDICEDKGIQDTGRLKGSIDYQVGTKDGKPAMTLGTPVEYGVYVEYGTGKYTSGGRQTPWSYQDEKGNWHRTEGMTPRPFIKPAIADNADHYKKVITEDLKDYFK